MMEHLNSNEFYNTISKISGIIKQMCNLIYALKKLRERYFFRSSFDF